MVFAMSDVIILIEETTEVDAIGQRKSKQTEREVFCEIGNISRSEWSAAVANGMKPDVRITISMIEYNGESLLKWRGTTYKVYRVYADFKNDAVELYCEKQVGVSYVREK